jgi:predicted dehydrogenase
METIRWGIISTGGIANAFAHALQTVPDAEVLAVGSRSQEGADYFGEQYGIPRRYDSYQQVADDPEIDVVYIGTPHVFHAENMRMCLEAGKHVLCEKPFTINAREAEECITLAREKGLFLMEAVWMRYIPAIIQLREWIREGRIGDLLMVQADFNVSLPFDAKKRTFARELGGGALLDVGLYPVNFTTMLLGLPESFSSHAYLGETGVDERAAILFRYPEGVSALLSMGIRHNTPNEALIQGTKGSIRVHPPFHHPTQMTLYLDGAEPETATLPYQSNGLNYEAIEVHTCLRANKLESDIMPLAETLAVMNLMDSIRAEWNLTYPADET